MPKTINDTTKTLATLPKYATLASFKGLVNQNIIDTNEPTTLAVDVLTGPIESFTTAPHFILQYLYDHRTTDVPTKTLYHAAQRQGYRSQDIRRSIREFLPKHANIGVWWDSRTRTEYARWYKWQEGKDNVTQKFL